MTIPRYTDARNDSNLIGFPFTLYCHLLHDFLSPVTFKAVKQEALATRWRVSVDTIARNLQVLVDLGYVERGPVRPGAARTYRLVYERIP